MYYLREKSILDEKSALSKAIEDGVQKGVEMGIQQGIQQGILETAKNLLDILDDDTIAIKTGLSLEIVKELRSKSID